MRFIDRHPAALLLAGVGLALIASLSPAGLDGSAVPPRSWAVWIAAIPLALAVFRLAGYPLQEGFRRIAWLIPFVVLLAGPAALFVPAGRRVIVVMALVSRALAAAAIGAAVATRLGPSGLVRGVRQLGLPDRLCEVLETMLASLALVIHQVRAMLRAREARRPAFGPWAALIAAPADTVRGFGRLVAALLLRSLERAEALELARQARGGGDE
jgi:energy-coupling factor transporter transmembrane protein EcfT